MSQKTILVTGGRGFVGSRLVEMLSAAEPKSSNIISLDIKPLTTEPSKNVFPNITQLVGDFTQFEYVKQVTKGVDIVYHVGGLVGPFYPKNLYYKVNVEGTKNIVEACLLNKVPILIFCSSPSTRFKGPHGEDIMGLSEKELDYPAQYTHLYSETKAEAERYVLAADKRGLMTCAIGPHQVYGPGDELFFPSFVEQMDKGRLRVIGDGKNYCSYTYVDNICHALMLGGAKIKTNPEIRGQFFVITDGIKTNMWETLDQALVSCGFDSIFKKLKVPSWVMLIVAYVLYFLGLLLGRQISKVNPFAVKMLTINRYFNIDKAKSLLSYAPLVSSEKAWQLTCQAIREKRTKQQLADFNSGRTAPKIFDGVFSILLYLSMISYVLFFHYQSFNILQNPKDWKYYDYIFFIGVLMILEDILDVILIKQYELAAKSDNLIKPNQNHFELDNKSKLIVFVNRLQSIPFIYAFIYYIWNVNSVKWEAKQLNIFNTLIAMPIYFIIYDFMYYFFHKYLHHPLIYRFIHKHHHQQFTPTRGYIDGINTHPLEYIGGSYMHIACVHFFPDNHAYTIILFMIIAGYLASINHTRIAFVIPGMYAVKDHDIHHNDVASNFGQYVMIWDYLFKTRRSSKGLKQN